MISKKLFAALTAGVLSVCVVTQANAAIIVADTVIDFFNSGANPSFPTGPYGGTFPGTFPVPVPLSYATDGDSSTFVSLPTDSFLTLGFSGGFVFDGPGEDLFISEVGGNDENADIFISSDFGLNFTFLGIATTATVSGFDLGSISYTQNVNAVKIVGLDNFGGSPGFDVSFVQGLEGSSVVTPDPVPVPATLALFGLGLAILASARRRMMQTSAWT